MFLYWGWDVPSAVVEEADGGSKTSGRAMLVSALTLLGIYGIVVVALQAYAGVGSDGIGLANEAIADDVLGVVASNAVGSVMGPLMEFAVFASALACLAAAVSPAARLLLSMGAYRALPSSFAKVHRSGSPRFATVGVALGVGAALMALSVISDEIVADAIGALVLFIALTYTLVCIACLRTFRREMTGSARDLLTRGVAPLVGAGVLGWAFVRSALDSLDPDYGSTVIFGVGGIFVIWAFGMVVGLVLMLIWNLAGAGVLPERDSPDQQHRRIAGVAEVLVEQLDLAAACRSGSGLHPPVYRLRHRHIPVVRRVPRDTYATAATRGRGGTGLRLGARQAPATWRKIASSTRGAVAGR